ncbi:Putative glycoside hydrolase family 18, catalytic domain, glycosyl hydrolase family 18 (GH18) active [Colletotrichum destructivum]|uniref:chitinase n=1 Tax=Colletotrichum destructivum TaxID=34406 RepID=A0AAX4IJY9_9PEZI|nr:Putative glycoside hydrolase family 18, catalytic domain, glycosyl hydrolase family 18 (GH18) active [Colletotrichum destructivum]
MYNQLFYHVYYDSHALFAQCDINNPCKVGCCSSSGVCGFEEAHCGDGCVSNCNSTSECGKHAVEESFNCPINVCCSRPSCPSATKDPLEFQRRIAYYELFTKGRSCGVKEPEVLPVDPLTHINLAFVNFGDDWKIIDDSPDWVKRVVLRKIDHPSLRVNIAIGGWAFNDPPTSTYFSRMASTYDSRQTFVDSVVEYLRAYGLDGVDIDWEYPGAEDRGGHPDDGLNYVFLLAALRKAFDDEGSGWEISVAIPSSYWYLRGYELERMQRHIDYFNLMSYDIYGMWDEENDWTGPYLKGHADWRKIDQGLDLLWRNGVKPENVVMGFGFYGRSFTMSDTNCIQPDGICQFSTGSSPGSCSDTAGVLTYYEIASRNNSLDTATFYDAENTVKYNVFEGTQWVSYDDAQSFRDKLDRLAERCLSGLMIWAIDQDTANFTAMNELFGDYSHLQLDGSSHESKEKLHDLFSQFTGQDCLVTERCTDGTDGEQGPQQVCPAGYSSVTTAHNPRQRHPNKLSGDCAKGCYRHVCCPKKSMPKSCEWVGAPERNVFGCSGDCGGGTFELNVDTAIDAKGNKQCYSGTRKLCCQSTKLFDDCFWNSCQGPLSLSDSPTCPDDHDVLTYRHDKPDGVGLCREEYGDNGSPLTQPFKSALCCPKGRSFAICNWTNQPRDFTMGNPDYCLPAPCGNDQVQVATGKTPPTSTSHGGRYQNVCNGVSLPPNTDPHFGFCCAPPSTWNVDWPVDPAHLWEEHFNDREKDKALWQYDTHHGHNDEDDAMASPGKIDGSDAYGFMMLNGQKEAIDDNFGSSHTVVRRTAAVPNVKREILTTNHTLIDAVFDHAKETIYVYCNYPAGSHECDSVFEGGAEDTVIRLPPHVGKRPFARIVSMELASDGYQLPTHHVRHRSLDGLHDNPVYKVHIDYNFNMVRQDRGPVQIRVDYTNLLGYWKELTDSKPSRVKRGFGEEEEEFTMRRFRNRVNRAEEHETRLRKRRVKRTDVVENTVPVELVPVRDGDDNASAGIGRVGKRWWGEFVDWLERLTTVRDSAVGDLPLDYADEIKIFEARWGCPGKTFHANLRMDLQVRMSMQATYAYYMSATFIPPTKKPDVFFYFGIEPEAYIGLTMEGNAVAKLTTGRKKIIDTVGYPGLAVKGIASVGPTLDVYGEIQGSINMHGSARAGPELTFGKAQAYWPQDESASKYDKILGLDLEDHHVPTGPHLAPDFEAGVQAEAAVSVIVQPEANVGIKVGGGKWTGGASLVDAQVTAFLKGALTFRAWAIGDIVDSVYEYGYGVYLYYNIGYKAKAQILEWFDWATGERKAYETDQKLIIYEPEPGKIDLSDPSTSSSKRMEPLPDSGYEGSGVLRRQSAENNHTSAASDEYEEQFRAMAAGTGGNANQNPGTPQFTNPIQCPAGNQPVFRVPELRFNCGAFPPIQIQDTNGQYETMTALCEGYKGTSTSWPLHLTHHANNPASHPQWDFLKRCNDAKRRQQCPNLASNLESCPYETQRLHLAVGHTDSDSMKLECDEFPWASSEEGGNYLPASERSQVCIPSVQNGLGGNCIAMLNFLETNVGKLEPGIAKVADRKSQWLYWGGKAGNDMDFWWTDKDLNGVKQRWTVYSDAQPIPAGYNPLNWLGQPTGKSWVFKRNYTFSLRDSGAQGTDWRGATGKRFVRPNQAFKNPNDYSSIVCGVNTFGQADYFRGPTDGNTNFNALCFTNKRQTGT